MDKFVSSVSDAGDKDLELELLDADVHSELSTTNLELYDWDPLEEEFSKNIHSGYVNNESAEVMLNGLENDDFKNICRYMRYKGICRRGESCPWSHKMPRKGKDVITLKNPFYELQEQLQKDYKEFFRMFDGSFASFGRTCDCKYRKIACSRLLSCQGFTSRRWGRIILFS
ncbi:hypothetical protein Anas_10402 [Armadillidium nasatum]|uniref:C3H1-type domain-containing protein n=1 Tax=Armadillidium nasatum TaxID=96803 RepID=A0A5N5STG1_9CRUS|nr:hypothetical protein Anas_10402 [Armadillidium nasatum]